MNPEQQARQLARQLIEQAGEEGIDPATITDDVLRTYPDLLPLLARQNIMRWIEIQLRHTRTSHNTPAYGKNDEGRWKQTEMFSVDEYRQAIERRLLKANENIAMAQRLADEAKRIYGVKIEIPEQLVFEFA